MNIEQLVEKLHSEHKVNPPLAQSQIEDIEEGIGYRLPSDLKQFYGFCNGSTMTWDSANFYHIIPLDKMRRVRVEILGEDEDKDQAAPPAWYALCDVQDGNYIGLDFESVSDSSCNIIDCCHESFGSSGDSTVIAKSFTKFLEQFLNAQGEAFWLEPDFKGYGRYNYYSLPEPNHANRLYRKQAGDFPPKVIQEE
jgi:cell wall assembly regulator SMI1